jgi:hypothetical protein
MVRKILSFYTKYFAVWVVLGGIAAYFVPGLFLTIEEGMKWFFASSIERLLPAQLRLASGDELVLCFDHVWYRSGARN